MIEVCSDQTSPLLAIIRALVALLAPKAAPERAAYNALLPILDQRAAYNAHLPILKKSSDSGSRQHLLPFQWWMEIWPVINALWSWTGSCPKNLSRWTDSRISS
ncbi:hypothetical protein LIER_03688 [Lithospermum erythrorhizon]|uniref:Uncharacterized protein n=1 Tax=Lithospermum erythrorhizon TaxID=34254 RepID=A0AAV3NYQ5_LITER